MAVCVHYIIFWL